MTDGQLTPIIAPAVEYLQVYSGHFPSDCRGNHSYIQRESLAGTFKWSVPWFLCCSFPLLPSEKFLSSWLRPSEVPVTVCLRNLGMGAHTLLLVGGVVSEEEKSALWLSKGFVAGARSLLIPQSSLARWDPSSVFNLGEGKGVKLKSNHGKDWLPGLSLGMSLDTHLRIWKRMPSIGETGLVWLSSHQHRLRGANKLELLGTVESLGKRAKSKC